MREHTSFPLVLPSIPSGRCRDIEFARPGGVPPADGRRLPEGMDNPPVIFIHGGGSRQGTGKRTGSTGFPRTNCTVGQRRIYRLSQEGILPGEVHDCKGAALAGCGPMRAEYGEEAARLAKWIVPYQLPSGLWSVFVDEPRLRPDTSGTAGIAAALAVGAAHGWLDDGVRAAAVECLAGLTPYLTPDGFLGGASQSNKGGPGLQRSDYRVIYQMGMGLMAQLIAALNGRESGARP